MTGFQVINNSNNFILVTPQGGISVCNAYSNYDTMGNSTVSKKPFKDVSPGMNPDTGFTFAIINGPTSNCQLSCASSFYSYLIALDAVYIKNTTGQGTINGYKKIGDHIKELLSSVFKNARTRNILLVDIPQNYLHILEKGLDPTYIISSQKYTSTNNSQMAIVLINVSRLTTI